jgi:hypothetical protein
MVDGRIVSIDAVVRGLACDCFCLKCGADLVAAKGEIYRHHFRHHVERGVCVGARETSIHQFAKQIICDRLFVALPDPIGTMTQATPECRLDYAIPDVLASYDTGDTVAIEIFVAHRVPADKVKLYNSQRQAAVEIDLHAYRLADKSETEWEAIVLHEADRSWLSPPSYIRVEREAERARWLKRQQQRLEEVKAHWREAQRARAEIEKALRELNAENAKRNLQAEQEAELILARQREREQQDRVQQGQTRLELYMERAKNAETRRVLEARLRREMRCPDLQELVQVHGGWDRITPEAWEIFDRDMANWKASARFGEFHLSPYRDLPLENDWRRTGAKVAQDWRGTPGEQMRDFPRFAPVAPVRVSPYGRETPTDAASGANGGGEK